MPTEAQMKLILEQSLVSGGDFAELFIEERRDLNISLVDRSIRHATSTQLSGVGLHLLNGRRRVYVYTSQKSFAALMQLARQAAGLMAANAARPAVPLENLVYRPVINPGQPEILPSTVAHQSKVELLRSTDLAARSVRVSLSRLAADYFDSDQTVTIANSEGLLTGERRVACRVRLQVTCDENGRRFYNWEDYARPQGFEAFAQPDTCADFARGLILRTRESMLAGSLPTCTVPVVLEAGSCGTLWHESCGHALEASAIAMRHSAFADKTGEKVASDKVTLLDDGTLPGLYGTSGIDDEGHPRQVNILIENGILKSYLCDRFHGRLIGRASTGSGRRQNYTFAPASRMSNTYLAAGQDDEDEMIRSVQEGLFVRKIGGGTGGLQFSLEVKEGFLIKNGQVDRPVSGLMITGSGIDVIKRIDRVGRNLVHEANGGFCGAASGLVPTTSSQPRVRIAAMTVGGEG